MGAIKRKTSILVCGMLLATLLVSPSPAVAATGDTLSMGEAINVAGRQRMLTQRIVKTYCLVGMGIESEESRQQLHDAIALFDRQLTMLEGFAESRLAVHPKIGEGLRQVRKLWAPLKTLALKTPAKDMASEVHDRAEILLTQSHLVVLMLESAAGTKAGHLANIAGRQRMLSQRIASLFLLRAWGISNPRYDKDAEQARADFAAALKEMNAAQINTPDINRRLEMVATQWRVFKLVSLFTEVQGVYPSTLGLVASSSDGILELMDEVTAMYASL